MTSQQVLAAARIGLALLETIAENPGSPGGVLYAGLMAQGCTLSQFQSIMQPMVARGFLLLEGECYTITDGGRSFCTALKARLQLMADASEAARPSA